MSDTRSQTVAFGVSRRSPVIAQLADEPLLAELKRRARASWAAGDYAEIARRELWPLGERIVERVEIRPGERVLDVACGTGNAALRAAGAGGRVTALDLTPELLDAGRALAAVAGLEIDWVEGDAETLPFPDESFDVLLSTLGVMFAPRHRVAAGELVRVLRPGGRLALCNWAEDSLVARTFRTIASYLPPAPAFAQPPWLWGSDEHVRSLFAGSDVELELERGVLELPPFASPDEEVEYHSTRLGPLMAARALAEHDGRWQALRAELTALSDGGSSSEYLLVLGGRRAAAVDTTKGT
jgi:SAM-dependent methyltransferase